MIMNMTVLSFEEGRPVMKSTAMCDQGRVGTRKGWGGTRAGHLRGLVLSTHRTGRDVSLNGGPPESLT